LMRIFRRRAILFGLITLKHRGMGKTKIRQGQTDIELDIDPQEILPLSKWGDGCPNEVDDTRLLKHSVDEIRFIVLIGDDEVGVINAHNLVHYLGQI